MHMWHICVNIRFHFDRKGMVNFAGKIPKFKHGERTLKVNFLETWDETLRHEPKKILNICAGMVATGRQRCISTPLFAAKKWPFFMHSTCFIWSILLDYLFICMSIRKYRKIPFQWYMHWYIYAKSWFPPGAANIHAPGFNDVTKKTVDCILNVIMLKPWNHI